MRPFDIKPTRRKKDTLNRSIYLSRELYDRVLEIATDRETSFSNVVVSMIEYCLGNPDTEEKK